mmetsp:Transcript_8123/g.34154  ORF Transcript_8123/g.34154 Transcript_8123/m.34154 type:complete len:162 (-) Transcript_8123:58-543(-)
MAAADGGHAWKMFASQAGRLDLFSVAGRPAFPAPDGGSAPASQCWLQGAVVWVSPDMDCVVVDDGTGLCFADYRLMNENTTAGCHELGQEVLVIGTPVYTKKRPTAFFKKKCSQEVGFQLTAFTIDVAVKATKVAPVLEADANALWIAEVLAIQTRLYPTA